MRDRLAAVLAPVLGEGVTVDGLTRLTGGASRTTWAFDAVAGETRTPLILRMGPPDEVHAGMELEAEVQRRAAAAGAPVPRILTADDSTAALGNPYLICAAVPGETIVRRIQRSLDDTGRAVLLRQCAQALAAIHRADPTGAGLTVGDQLTEWHRQLDEIGDTTATFEWTFRRLAADRPPPSEPVLVHGDFRMGNLIVDGGRLAAVLDWELTHLGEVYEDLAWFCIRAWRFGAPRHLGAGGLGSVADFLTAYEEAGGRPVDRQTFRWWLTVATLRWGVICRYQAERHLSGQTRSVELAAIGRRVAETEWDLLDLLDRGGPAESRQTPMSARAKSRQTPMSARAKSRSGGIHGRPTAAELVAAVAEFLETDVREACTGSVNFHARVAANVLRIVERELLDESVAADEALTALGFSDEAQLAAAIRAGDLDDRADELTACLRTLVRQRLAVAHPGYEDQ
ncbi:phosphotransferase family protein [Mycolicibacterium thermoresistibile]|uniref:Aminoglycoside phosphotransferase n=2 Tax=Mycolicibacterium thermoresistibile TaxID=1797 RepID=G7CLH6_MYCT3|nr:phosphotransferase family protein [Mycolicibacterium thermoresistibile]EHI11252.1 aminoglycoside phosphotransferase [Mycolicibacterium thermoresistibile ATCC 19527]MCV7188660.1 phosphotransferase family protein [Mycolicibacterium thermoresistibile]GAT16070.1 aminoglycoside phosphotransferase [Mycolicibacterium thermoresistibile]SNW17548.1 aminoglycoside phosphotransferase [Mycolicibacterium thermoresistibile]